MENTMLGSLLQLRNFVQSLGNRAEVKTRFLELVMGEEIYPLKSARIRNLLQPFQRLT